MSILSSCFAIPGPAADRGFAAVPSLGASQRASLGRGLAFVLLLAAASLASAYVPLALHGPEWVDGTAPAPAASDR